MIRIVFVVVLLVIALGGHIHTLSQEAAQLKESLKAERELSEASSKAVDRLVDINRQLVDEKERAMQACIEEIGKAAKRLEPREVGKRVVPVFERWQRVH